MQFDEPSRPRVTACVCFAAVAWLQSKWLYTDPTVPSTSHSLARTKPPSPVSCGVLGWSPLVSLAGCTKLNFAQRIFLRATRLQHPQQPPGTEAKLPFPKTGPHQVPCRFECIGPLHGRQRRTEPMRPRLRMHDRTKQARARTLARSRRGLTKFRVTRAGSVGCPASLPAAEAGFVRPRPAHNAESQT